MLTAPQPAWFQLAPHPRPVALALPPRNAYTSRRGARAGGDNASPTPVSTMMMPICQNNPAVARGRSGRHRVAPLPPPPVAMPANGVAKRHDVHKSMPPQHSVNVHRSGCEGCTTWEGRPCLYRYTLALLACYWCCSPPHAFHVHKSNTRGTSGCCACSECSSPHGCGGGSPQCRCTCDCDCDP